MRRLLLSLCVLILAGGLYTPAFGQAGPEKDIAVSAIKPTNAKEKDFVKHGLAEEVNALVYSTVAYLKYKGVTVGDKSNSRNMLVLITTWAGGSDLNVAIQLQDMEGNVLWTTDWITGEKYENQGMFDPRWNTSSKKFLIERIHSVIDKHAAELVSSRPVAESARLSITAAPESPGTPISQTAGR